MFLLGFHIITISILALAVWLVAYRIGFRDGVRRAERALAEPREESG